MGWLQRLSSIRRRSRSKDRIERGQEGSTERIDLGKKEGTTERIGRGKKEGSTEKMHRKNEKKNKRKRAEIGRCFSF